MNFVSLNDKQLQEVNGGAVFTITMLVIAAIGAIGGGYAIGKDRRKK